MDQLTKINKILIFALLLVVFLYYAASFLIPFIFAILFAFLMIPLSTFLEKKGMHRAIASLLSTLAVFIVFGGTLFLLITQINAFTSEMPSMEDKIASLIESSQNIIQSVTNLSMGEQDDIIEDRSEQIISKIEPFVTKFFGNIFSTVFSFFLILVYVFLMLLYREKIYDFLMMYIPKSEKDPAKETLSKISQVAFHYLWGRLQVMILLGIMFFITFLSFGMPYALLFALFGSVITIIPYIGPLLGGFLPLIFSLLFFDSWQKVLLLAGLIIVIQLLESYVIEPLLLGKEVKLNAMAIIVAIVIGGIIWGVAGMILFVPIFAIIKIISLSQSGLRPIGFLLGHREKAEFEK